MKLFRSFAFKNAIFYFFVFLSGLGVIGYFMLNNSSKRIIETAKNRLTHNSDLVEIQLVDYIDGLIAQVSYLSNSPILKKYLTYEDSSSYHLLSQNYLSVIRSNSDFFQIRYIEATYGKEVVRVDQLNGKARIVQADELQYKANRPYFLETKKLDSGGIYFSDINLNREFGKISEPKTPTLRIACPLYHNSILKGVIIINTDLTKLFDRLKKTVGNDFNLRMLNNDGYYLMHEEEDSTFTFEYGRNVPQINTELNDHTDEVVSLPNQLISKHRVKVEPMKYDFIYHVIADRPMLMSSYYQWRRTSILLIIFTGLIFTLIAFYILRRQSQTFRKLTNSMRQFPTERQTGDLPLKREDEIGELARSFQEMSSIINKQISNTEEAKQNAELAERDKSEFIENISHEIRNPLQSIIGLNKMLEQNSPNPNQMDILNSIKLNTNNLMGLVNDILDYQNIINGNYKSKYSWVNVEKLIQDLLIGNQYTASKKSIQLISKIDEKLKSIDLKLDSLRVSQILGNLISNAITHTSANGKIWIELDIIRMDERKVKVAYSVSDDGVGMNKQELLRIKERYFTNKKNFLGISNFGLGLTIVNELLTLLDSELKVSSEENVGSTFYFELESEYRTSASDKLDKELKDTAIKEKNVLIIDDDKQILDLYQYFFKNAKSRFISSLEELKGEKDLVYDIIITDYRLKNSLITDHLEQLKEIASESTALLIASGAEPNMNTIRATFPTALFIRKPFSNSQLQEQIKLGIVLSKFGVPILEQIKADYDYKEEKYSRALKLLLKEWQTYSQRLDQCMEDENEEELEEILHKFTTTLKRLSLPALEIRLMKVKEIFQSGHKAKEQEHKEIKDIMMSYQSYLEQII